MQPPPITTTTRFMACLMQQQYIYMYFSFVCIHRTSFSTFPRRRSAHLVVSLLKTLNTEPTFSVHMQGNFYFTCFICSPMCHNIMHLNYFIAKSMGKFYQTALFCYNNTILMHQQCAILKVIAPFIKLKS